MDYKDIMIVELSKTMGKVLGASAAAIMKTAGKAASYQLWPELPSGESAEKQSAIMAKGCKEMGGGQLSFLKNDHDQITIERGDCLFASMIATSARPYGQHPICYFDLGLLEEGFKRLTGMTLKAEFVHRKDEQNVCMIIAKTKQEKES